MQEMELAIRGEAKMEEGLGWVSNGLNFFLFFCSVVASLLSQSLFSRTEDIFSPGCHFLKHEVGSLCLAEVITQT